MTTATATSTPVSFKPTTAVRPQTFGRTVHAEWIKFWTVRSTVWTLIATVTVMVGISMLAAWGSTIDAVDAGSGPMNTAQLLSAGYQLAQLSVAVLGVLTIAGEYSTGMIRSTIAAVPRRVPVLAAKALVLSAVVAGVSVVSMALSYVATMPWQGRLDATFDLGERRDASHDRWPAAVPHGNRRLCLRGRRPVEAQRGGPDGGDRAAAGRGKRADDHSVAGRGADQPLPAFDRWTTRVVRHGDAQRDGRDDQGRPPGAVAWLRGAARLGARAWHQSPQ